MAGLYAIDDTIKKMIREKMKNKRGQGQRAEG